MKRTKNDQRLSRGARVRAKIGAGTPEKPRLVVFRSNSNISAQIVDDCAGKTLVSVNSLKMKDGGGNTESAKKVGFEIAEKAKSAKIQKVIFDRSGYAFHGRVKALAESAREAGLRF